MAVQVGHENFAFWENWSNGAKWREEWSGARSTQMPLRTFDVRKINKYVGRKLSWE